MSDDLNFTEMTKMVIDTALDGAEDEKKKREAERMLAARELWRRALQKIAAGKFKHAYVYKNLPAVKIEVRKFGQPSAMDLGAELNEIANGFGYEVRASPLGYGFDTIWDQHAIYICRRTDDKGNKADHE